MKHRDIWRAIDQLAAHHELSTSGLARRAGLDSTAFNPSKRAAKDGRLRWPSTESLSRVLDAVGTSFDDFASLVDGTGASHAPLIGFAQAGRDGFFDDAGFPIGDGWEQIAFPGLGEGSVYALEISGDSMEPAYRAGDRIVVSPSAEVRAGDRVVARTQGGEVMAKVLVRQTSEVVELGSLNPDYPARVLGTVDVAWLARILWASQ